MGRRWTLPWETWASLILPSRHQRAPWSLPSYLVSSIFFSTPAATLWGFLTSDLQSCKQSVHEACPSLYFGAINYPNQGGGH